MKNILIFAAIAGIAGAVAIYLITSGDVDTNDYEYDDYDLQPNT